MAKLTRAGVEKIEREIAELEERLAAVLLEKADAALVGGDGYHDNAAFENYEQQERMLRRSISDRWATLKGAEIVEAAAADGTVAIGSRVTLSDESGTRQTWTIAGHGESAPKEGRIAYDTPLGQAIFGKAVGEECEVVSGRLRRRVRIEEVE